MQGRDFSKGFKKLRKPIRRKSGEVSLERALSKLGYCTRTEARAWILAGRVRVGGQVVLHPGKPVYPERARIEVDGQSVQAACKRWIAFHKPRGVVVTKRDERGRRTIYDCLPRELHGLAPVGRLDQASSGLLLLTNDHSGAEKLLNPESKIPKTYVVTVSGRVSEEAVRNLTLGIREGGEILRAEQAQMIKVSGRESHLRMVLIEGKNREIRRMMAALGHEVTRLKRVAMGGVELGDLAPGKWREIESHALRNFGLNDSPAQHKGQMIWVLRGRGKK